MKHYAILLTVFNRVDCTIKCLKNLSLASALCSDVTFDIYLTDDNSTDTTKQQLEEQFPQVKILQGDGNLFWCRGMVNSWNAAIEYTQTEYDGYFWLNNDSYIYPEALQNVLDSSLEKNDMAIISGCFRSEKTGLSTYGGRLKGQTRNLDPNGSLQIIDWMNGNLVFVPKYVFNKIGTLDPTFWHAIGDYDYGLRAKENDIQVLLSKDYVGVCEEHDRIEACYDPKIPIKKRFKNFYSPLGDDPFIRFLFLKRHYSVFKATKSFFISHLFVIFPSFMKLYNNKNR